VSKLSHLIPVSITPQLSNVFTSHDNVMLRSNLKLFYHHILNFSSIFFLRFGNQHSACYCPPFEVICRSGYSGKLEKFHAPARNALVMSGVSFVMEITLPTTRDVRFIRTSKKKLIQPSDQNNTLPPHPYNRHCTPNLESLTLKSQRILLPALLPHKILPTSPLNPNSLLVITKT
jgi:hypothetical protein